MLYQIIRWSSFMAEINNAIYETLGERWYEAWDDPIALLRAESRVKHPWILKKNPRILC